MKQIVNRRFLLKGASWVPPVVLATAEVPAYASSPTDRAAATSAPYGLFVEISNTYPIDSYSSNLGVSSFFDSGDTVSEGTFPPASSITPPAHGLGFWIGLPEDAQGQGKTGVTTLPTGATFDVTYSFTFDAAPSIYSPYGPADGMGSEWDGAQGPFSFEATNGNDARFSVSLDAPTISGKVWSATAHFKTLSDMSVSSGSDTPFKTLLLGHAAVYYDNSALKTLAEVTVKPRTGALVVISGEIKTSIALSTIPAVTARMSL